MRGRRAAHGAPADRAGFGVRVPAAEQAGQEIGALRTSSGSWLIAGNRGERGLLDIGLHDLGRRDGYPFLLRALAVTRLAELAIMLARRVRLAGLHAKPGRLAAEDGGVNEGADDAVPP